MIKYIFIAFLTFSVGAQTDTTDAETIEDFSKEFFDAIKYMDENQFKDLMLDQDELLATLENADMEAEQKSALISGFADVVISDEQQNIMMEVFRDMQKTINKKELRVGLRIDEYFWQEQDTGLPEMRIAVFKYTLVNGNKKFEVSVEIMKTPNGWQILRAFEHDF